MVLLLGCPYQVQVKYYSREDSSFRITEIEYFTWTTTTTPVDSYDPSRGPYKLYESYYETYTIQTGTFDRRDWYLSSSGHAIWYQDGKWRVGTEENKGTTRGVFDTNDDRKCPNLIPKYKDKSVYKYEGTIKYATGFDWKYYVPSIGEWVDAGYGMYIE